MKYLAIYLVIINALSMLLMLIDKIKAKKKLWRIPELRLLTLCAIGGSLGGLLAMNVGEVISAEAAASVQGFASRNPLVGMFVNDAMIEFIGKCPLIIATFGGHWHGEAERIAPNGAKMFVTPGLFKGICRMIEIR